MQTSPARLGDINAAYARSKQLGEVADYIIAKGLRVPLPGDNRFEKAQVLAQTTGNSSALTAETAAFRDVVVGRTVLGQLPTLKARPLQRVPRETEAPTVTWLNEAGAIPLARMSFDSVTLGDHKLVSLLATTQELMRFGDADARNLILRLATRQLVRELDRSLLGTTSGSDTRPAGLLADVVPLSGGSPADLAAEVELLVAAVSDGRATAPFFVASPRAVAYLAAHGGEMFRDAKLSGGSILGAPLLTSPGAANNLILIDGAELVSYDGGIEITNSGHADIEMVDNPTTGAATRVSCFQTNTVAIKFIHFVTWAKLQDDAVAYLELDAIGGSPA